MSSERRERGQYKVSFEQVISYAIENMLADGTHMPTFVIEGSKNVIASQLQGMPETHGERMELMRFLGQQTAMSGRVDRIQQVFMISEAWRVAASKDEPAKIQPSKDPSRKEVLTISSMEMLGRKKRIKLFNILRDDNEQFIELEEYSSVEKEKDGLVEVPLLEAFVHGFQTASQIKYN